MDLSSILICNGCSKPLAAGEMMVCAGCAAKLPPPLPYTIAPARDLSHVVPGTCSCECHDTPGILHFAPCCEQTYEPRAQLRPRSFGRANISPKAFEKFVFPLVRGKAKG